jgi:cytohesin
MAIRNPFFKAVKEGNKGEVTRLLNADPGLLEERGEYTGKRPLAEAAEHGQLDMVKLLIERGADASAKGAFGRMALHEAAYCGNEETVAFLLEQAPQANSRDRFSRTPFMWACVAGHVGAARILLQHVGDQALHETDLDGDTALHLAAYNGHEEAVAFLLGQGAQANSRKRGGKTLFQMACQEGQLGVVRLLLQHMGEDALQQTDGRGWTALHYAAEWGCEEVVRFLLFAGADPTITDNQGRTPRALIGSQHVFDMIGGVGRRLEEDTEDTWQATRAVFQVSLTHTLLKRQLVCVLNFRPSSNGRHSRPSP